MRKRALLIASLAVAASAALPPTLASAQDPGEIVGLVTNEVNGTVNDVNDQAACRDQYQSGDVCQGDDHDASPSACSIGTWVQSATCELTGTGGEVHSVGLGFSNKSDGSDPVTYDITLRDEATGTVLFQTSDSGGSPSGPVLGMGVDGITWNTNGGNGIGAAITPFATDAVICQITGTHSQFGATFPEARNSFSCSVNQ